MTRVLVTGASGFVGRSLTRALAQSGHVVWGAAREPQAVPEQTNINPIALPDLANPAPWNSLLAGMDVVIHLAGIAHAGSDIPDATYDQINRDATQSLAQAAAENGVKHFILLSSIRAQTAPTARDPLNENDLARPTDAYGRSKLAAESAVRKSGVPFTVLRPVVIYGPGVKANLASLVKFADTPYPLPFGRFRNLRSLLAMENLVSAIRFLIEQSGPRNETYVVADPAPVTFAEIILILREALGRPPRLLNVPPWLLTTALRLTGQSSLAERIGGTLVADAHKLRMAGWRPAVDTKRGLKEMIRAQSGEVGTGSP
jgi:nucleoside-diphosphate-sugar epimerase